jgi:hypothetical protein
MRKALFTLALLASASTLPLTAHADTIDDFVLKGDGHTATFSLPASPTNVIPIVIMTGPNTIGFQVPASVTYDGETSTEFLTFIGNAGPTGFRLPTPSGTDSFSVEMLYSGPNSAPTFLTGTFNLSLFSVEPPLGSYTLTIIPETSAPTPEPSSLVLFATGAFGLLLLSLPKTAIGR